MNNTKTYWSILETFYNGKKVSIIPPLLINDKLISDFEIKSNLFKKFFASQCTPLDNSSKITESETYITNTRLSSIEFDKKGIINVIRSLSVGKAPGYDNISIRTLKICDSTFVEPLSIMFNNCINQSLFPNIWKRSNICPICKKATSK